MSWKIHIDPDVNCVFVKLYGNFELDQFTGIATDISNHPDYRVGMNSLRDLRDQSVMTDLSFKSLADQAKRAMDQYGDKLGKCRMAIVAGDVQSYAKVHQYIVAGKLGDYPIERKAFRDIEKAMAWLGVPRDYEIKYPAPDET